MLVPFGTHVRDKDGMSVGTVSRLVLHPDSRQVVALVVRQGVRDRRADPHYVDEPGTVPAR
jgi:sporulation protein YlmC with PRC-barrel domain